MKDLCKRNLSSQENQPDSKRDRETFALLYYLLYYYELTSYYYIILLQLLHYFYIIKLIFHSRILS